LPFPPKKEEGSYAFVSKLSFDARSGKLALAYSTYLGGSLDRGPFINESCNGIAVDLAGNAYVTGVTSSPDFPLVNPLTGHDTLSGSRDAFVSKLSFNAETGKLALAYSTYLGGRGLDVGFGISDESGFDIAVDLVGNAYVTGWTSSPDFPLMHPFAAPNNVLQGRKDAFVAKIGLAGQ
jgi:Beta-propeller repeat